MPGDRLSSALPPLVGGILIGGGSRRMGRPKALLEWDGATFVERIAAALRAVVPEIVLLGAASGLPASLGPLPRIADLPGPPGQQGPHGPIRGLLAAFEFRPGAAWLILSCDQPLLTAATLEWLIAERRPGRIAVLARRTPERIEPFPGIYEPGCRSALAALAEPERRGSLQPLAALPGVQVVAVPDRFAAELQGVNTPAELAELRRTAAL
jgi:molybdopterin-guanine dinucleotide biosynthesis protein A